MRQLFKEYAMERPLKSIILFCFGLLFATTTLAQDIFKDGFDEPIVLLPTEITDFSALPSTVEEGQITTVSWATENADSCTASDTLGEFDGPVATSGSVDLIFATAGSYDLTLTCEGDLDPAIAVLTITVEEKTNTTNCDTPPFVGVLKQWSDFWGTDFPGPISGDEISAVVRTGYMAIEFDTGDIVDSGLFVSIGLTITTGTRFGAVSECPGEFDVAPECDHSWGIGGGITWATDGTTGACTLKPNTTYFFNITFTDGFDPNSSTCTSSQCKVRMQYINRP